MESSSTPTPVMDVVPPENAPNHLATPPPEEPDSRSELKGADNVPKKPESLKPASAKQPGSGIAAAIVGTVIIVLSLAALATYAYLKTRK